VTGRLTSDAPPYHGYEPLRARGARTDADIFHSAVSGRRTPGSAAMPHPVRDANPRGPGAGQMVPEAGG